MFDADQPHISITLRFLSVPETEELVKVEGQTDDAKHWTILLLATWAQGLEMIYYGRASSTCSIGHTNVLQSSNFTALKHLWYTSLLLQANDPIKPLKGSIKVESVSSCSVCAPKEWMIPQIMCLAQDIYVVTLLIDPEHPRNCIAVTKKPPEMPPRTP